MLRGVSRRCIIFRMANNTGTFRTAVAGHVRAEMGRLRVSQSELARRLSEGQPWVNRRVNGDVALNVDDLERIAAALNVPLHKLLGWTDGVRGPSTWNGRVPALAAA
jgi:transcriptional regulator with XRE-family HTH domain